MASDIKEKKMKDEAAYNQIWREHIKKENATLRPNEEFRLTRGSISMYPEKPNLVEPSKISSGSYAAGIVLSDEMQQTLNQTQKGPIEKYSGPATEAQEIGWFHEELMKGKKHNRSSCEITKYAADYSQSLGRNPFARKPAS